MRRMTDAPAQRLSLRAAAVFYSATLAMASPIHPAHAQQPFNPKDPLAQIAKCALGEEESRRTIVRDLLPQFSLVPAERPEGIGASVANGALTPARWFSDTVFISPKGQTAGRFCSGVHVGGGAILTAGHCICSLDLWETPATVSFQMRHDVYTIDTIPEKTVALDPDICTGTPQPGRDLAILFPNPKHLVENIANNPALLGSGVRPAIAADGSPIVPTATLLEAEPRRSSPSPRIISAVIASREALVTGRHDRMLVVGYGADERGGSRVKRQACVPVVSGICGGADDPERFGCAPGGEIVLRDPVGGADTCQGDSGGAVYTVVRDRGLYYYHLAAITSRGLAGDRCGPGGIYTLITPSVVAWMRRNGVPVGNYPYPGQ